MLRMTLGEAFEQQAELPWRESVFLIPQENIEASNPLIVDDTQEDNIVVNGEVFLYAVKVTSFQDIVENLRAQRPACSTEDLIIAFKYYLAHDAYISM